MADIALFGNHRGGRSAHHNQHNDYCRREKALRSLSAAKEAKKSTEKKGHTQ